MGAAVLIRSPYNTVNTIAQTCDRTRPGTSVEKEARPLLRLAGSGSRTAVSSDDDVGQCMVPDLSEDGDDPVQLVSAEDHVGAVRSVVGER